MSKSSSPLLTFSQSDGLERFVVLPELPTMFSNSSPQASEFIPFTSKEKNIHIYNLEKNKLYKNTSSCCTTSQSIFVAKLTKSPPETRKTEFQKFRI
jgi:hypothetical protein